MLIILITIITTSAARTTYSPVNIENNSEYRSYVPELDANLNFGNSNGHQWIPAYSYPPVYESGVKFSEVFQGHGSNVHRSVNPQYSRQYPYQNGNGQWNRQTVTEASQLSDRFGKNRNEGNVFDHIKTRTTKKPEVIVIQYKRRVNNTTDIKTQSQDVNVNQHNIDNYTRQYQITTEKVHTNFNTTNIPNIYPEFMNNKNTNQSSSNSYHSSIQNTKNNNTDNSTKTNVFSLKPINNTVNTNNSVNRSDYDNFTIKTKQDNEVTSTYEARSDTKDDRWIWSNSEVQETTTLVALDDRAAFAGGNCPTGTVRFQDRCVDVD